MTATLKIQRAGPALTVQDKGRPGLMAHGLSQGGAADRLALIEGAALLDQSPGLAAIEMAGFGGQFVATRDLRIALTGAPMVARIGADDVTWNSVFTLAAGQILRIDGAKRGNFGYLHVGGGIDTPVEMGSRSAHLAGGLGQLLTDGDELPLGKDPVPDRIGVVLDVADRFDGGTIAMLPSTHTDAFDAAIIDRFVQTTFYRTPRGNRQGAELGFDGAPFATADQLTNLSEAMLAGDIQMTGEGRPFVLLPECQTTGGYPRIGRIVPADLPRVAQATPDMPLRFAMTDHAAASARLMNEDTIWRGLRAAVRPLRRDPHMIQDLLGYQLISGAITGWDTDQGDKT